MSETPRERLNEIERQWPRIGEGERRWLIRVCEAAIEAEDSGALARVRARLGMRELDILLTLQRAIEGRDA